MRVGILVAAAIAAGGMWVSSADAEPFRVQDLTAQLKEAGVENVEEAILFGQPMVNGRIKRFGFVIGLRECARVGRDDLFCQEAAFKSCVMLGPGRTREELLELANKYNLSRRIGYLALDRNDRVGALMCVQQVTDFRDDNVLERDEVLGWEYTVDDFRAFLIDENIELLDPSQL